MQSDLYQPALVKFMLVPNHVLILGTIWPTQWKVKVVPPISYFLDQGKLTLYHPNPVTTLSTI